MDICGWLKINVAVNQLKGYLLSALNINPSVANILGEYTPGACSLHRNELDHLELLRAGPLVLVDGVGENTMPMLMTLPTGKLTLEHMLSNLTPGKFAILGILSQQFVILLGPRCRRTSFLFLPWSWCIISSRIVFILFLMFPCCWCLVILLVRTHGSYSTCMCIYPL